MSTFLLTPKVNIPLSHGMRIEKGTLPFIVEIPFGHLPFDSIASKNMVKNCMMARGIDILSNGFCKQDGLNVQQAMFPILVN